MKSFNFLKNEIEHEGQLIKVGDVWGDDDYGNGNHKVIAMVGNIVWWCRDDKAFSNDYIPDFIAERTLIERDGMPWPREEKSCRHTKDKTRCLVCSPHIVLAGIADETGYIKYPKLDEQSPALVVGRRYWNRIGEWHTYQGCYDGMIIFDPGCVYSDMASVAHCFDLSRDWWTECAVGMWVYWEQMIFQVESNVKRDSGVGRKIESGEIKLYPSRGLAEENNNG